MQGMTKTLKASEETLVSEKSLSRVWLFVVSIQFSSVAQLCLTLCDPMDCSTPGLPVHHQLPELTKTHVRWVHDLSDSQLPVLFLLTV